MAEPVSTGEAQASGHKENYQENVEAASAPESDEEDSEEDTYVVPAGQGSFSFQQGLLLFESPRATTSPSATLCHTGASNRKMLLQEDWIETICPKLPSRRPCSYA